MRRPLKKLLISPIALAFAVAWVSSARAAAAKGKNSSAMGGSSRSSGSMSSSTGSNLRSFTSHAEIKGIKSVSPGDGRGGPTTGSGPVSGGPTTSAGSAVGGKPSSAAAAKTFGGFGRPLKAKRASKLKPLSGL